MKAPPCSTRTAFKVLGLSFFGAALFAAGTGRAFAPEPKACSAIWQPIAEASEAKQNVRPKRDRDQLALARYLARRYQIAREATRAWVRTAYRAAGEVGLDPLLVLAVISVESSFDPDAESASGAQGLMQIIPRFHEDELLEAGGEDAAFDPQTNIVVGTRILRRYVYRAGTLEAGLQYYNGAAWDASAQYAQKVLAERDRLERLLRPIRSPQQAMDAGGPAETQGS